MTNEIEALEAIRQALAKAVNKPVEIEPDTDLFESGILDSLDSMIFFLQVEEISGKKFPEGDLGAQGYSKVSKIIEFLLED